MSETSSMLASYLFLSVPASVPPVRPGAGPRDERVILPKNPVESSHRRVPNSSAAVPSAFLHRHTESSPCFLLSSQPRRADNESPLAGEREQERRGSGRS